MFKNIQLSIILQFIARAANLPQDRIGHNQKPHTSECYAIKHKHPSSRRSTVFIDTPGFNNTDGDDIVVLRKIGGYLAETYAERFQYTLHIYIHITSRCKRSCTVPVIVYLHKILDNRMAGSVMQSLNHLSFISGPGKRSNVVLVTTLWSELAQDIGVRREQELRNIYWKELLSMGCKYNRFDNSTESAWAIINRINVQDSTQEANEIRRRFNVVQEQEQRRQYREETQRKSFLSKFLGLFKLGKNKC